MAKDISWHLDGLCTGHPDPDLWHYKSTKSLDERRLYEYRMAEAISLCNQCPVQARCLAQGLEDENMTVFQQIEGTIWGGKTLGERLNIRDKRITVKFGQESRLLREVHKKIAKISQ